MGHPAPERAENLEMLSFRVDEVLLARIVKYAKKHKLSRSEAARKLLEASLGVAA